MSYQGWPRLTKFKDVTHLFDAASEALEVGQLIHGETFTLWEAMSAIEIMDPKMDTGMDLPPEAQQGKLTADKVAEKTFTAGELIGVMDGILSRESYIIGVLKCAAVIRNEVIKANVCHEEDFSTDTLGFSLLDVEVPETDAVARLTRAEDDINIFRRKAKEKPTEAPGADLLNCPPGREIEYCDALLARIRFRKAFFSALTHLSKRDVRHAKKNLANALSQLKIIQDTTSLGEDVSDAFDPLVNRLLFTQAPPRPINEMTLTDACAQLQSMLTNLQSVCNAPSRQSLDSLLGFMDHLGLRSPGPNVLTRSLLHSISIHEGSLFGRLPIQDVIEESVRTLCDPPFFSWAEEPFKLTKKMFLERSVQPVLSYLKLYGYNRSRQRRQLNKLVYEWEKFQEEVEAMDMDLHNHARAIKSAEYEEEPFSLSSWVYFHKLNMLTSLLFLGFELDLYGAYEHLMVFWYLKYLLETQLEHAERICRARTASMVSGAKAATKKNTKSRKPQTDNGIDTLASIMESQTLVYARQLILTALFQAALALHKAGHLRKPDHDLYDEKVHYEHRFALFTRLGSPLVLPYDQFAETIGNQIDTVPALTNAAHANLQSAKQHLEKLYHVTQASPPPDSAEAERRNEVQSLVRVCLANTIAIKSLKIDTGGAVKKSGGGGGGERGRWFELKYHPTIPTLVVPK
ncbi:N-alpha-acetyltransferase 35 NatC auxiliary subunit [Borealophlyctis nickersoniae]|nr:N-alpha-acetyltransferase 35 NatC auxiliary subunit [Borealophlyctis nickersoniae]